jgi:hypothetical protein
MAIFMSKKYNCGKSPLVVRPGADCDRSVDALSAFLLEV